MNEFTKTKKYKKIIVILVTLLLFNYCYTPIVNATFNFEGEDFLALPAEILFWIEKGILKVLNNIFTSSTYNAKYFPTYADVSEANPDYENYNGNIIQADGLFVVLHPESIIKGRFILFDADIFKEINGSGGYYDYVSGGSIANGKQKLREIVAGWYYALRNFAIVALLSVLVYVGIRMILSTVAQDKAKYKTMFKDWLVALCLVIVMHYMMIGILNITTMITEAIGRERRIFRHDL